MKNIKIIVEKTDTGFSAYASDFAIFTTGTNIPELIANVYEATDFYFEEERVKPKHRDIRLEIDLQQFFKYYKVLNAKFLAEKIGMNPTLLSQYVQGHKKPSEKQTQKILSGINQIGQELSGLNLLQQAI